MAIFAQTLESAQLPDTSTTSKNTVEISQKKPPHQGHFWNFGFGPTNQTFKALGAYDTTTTLTFFGTTTKETLPLSAEAASAPLFLHLNYGYQRPVYRNWILGASLGLDIDTSVVDIAQLEKSMPDFSDMEDLSNQGYSDSEIINIYLNRSMKFLAAVPNVRLSFLPRIGYRLQADPRFLFYVMGGIECNMLVLALHYASKEAGENAPKVFPFHLCFGGGVNVQISDAWRLGIEVRYTPAQNLARLKTSWNESLPRIFFTTDTEHKISGALKASGLKVHIAVGL